MHLCVMARARMAYGSATPSCLTLRAVPHVLAVSGGYWGRQRNRKRACMYSKVP